MGLLNHRVDRAFIDVGDLHQPHAGPPGRPRHHGELPRRQAPPLPGALPARGGQRRRPRGGRDRADHAGRGHHVRHRRGGRLPGDGPEHERLRYALHPPPRGQQVPRGDPGARPVLGGQRAGRRGGLPPPGARPGGSGCRTRPDAPGPRAARTLRDPPRFVRDRGLRPLPRLPGQGALRHPGLRAGPGHHRVRLRRATGTPPSARRWARSPGPTPICVSSPRTTHGTRTPRRSWTRSRPGSWPPAPGSRRFADRRRAIAFALSAAGPDDIVLVAGKGSEPYQIVGEQLIPFSDMATVRELAAAQG